MSTSTAVTRGIRVSVDARFSPEHSAPARQHWCFVYAIRIENTGELAVQVRSRHWFITDADGHVEEIAGDGVVGQQPVLMPGESFDYQSGCAIGTSSGSMAGTYQVIAAGGEAFDVEIARFALQGPYSVH